MPQGPPAPGSRLTQAWAWAGLLFFGALAALEVFLWRPGVGAPEELQSLASVWGSGHGLAEPVRFGGSSATRGLQSLVLVALGDWRAVYLVNAMALGLEALFFLRLAGPASRGAGALAVLLALASPFTTLRARTLFSYVLVPAFSLGLALALRQRQGRVSSFLAGLISAVLWLDYEGWILAAPGLAAAWASAPRDNRASGRWLALGTAAGLLLVAGLSAPFLAEWWQARTGSHAGAGAGAGQAFLANLRSYFLGGPGRRAMGLEEAAAFPLIAWPGLLAGILAGPRWLWVWALGGLAGLIPGGPFQEPNRAIAAWPALMAISGWGWWSLLSPLQPGVLRVALPLLALAGPLQGFLQFDRAVSRWDAQVHGLSRRWMAAARVLDQRSARRPLRLLCELDASGPGSWPLQGAFHLYAPRLGPAAPDAETWVLVPRPYADPQDPRWGLWLNVSPGGPPLYLLRAHPRVAPLLALTEERLIAFRQALPRSQASRLEALRRPPPAGDPWTWSALAEERARHALALGRAQPQDIQPLFQGPCLSSRAYEHLARALPDLAPGARAQLRALSRPGARLDLYLRGL